MIWKAGAVVALLVAFAGPRASAQPCMPPVGPKILVLRGVFEVFSLGMNDLARKLRCRGYDATSTSWALALLEADCSDNRPLVVIGHSLGGRMCGWTSRKFMSCGRRVPLTVVVDANLLKPIPPNIDKCLNLYVTNAIGIFHGSPVRAESPDTNLINWDVSAGQPSMFLGGVNHFDIDATDWVHDIIIREIECMFPLHPATPAGIVEGASAIRRLNASRSPNLEASFESTSDSDIAIDFASPTRQPMSRGPRREVEATAKIARRGSERVPWQPTRPSRAAADEHSLARERTPHDRSPLTDASVDHCSYDDSVGSEVPRLSIARTIGHREAMSPSKSNRPIWQPTRPSRALAPSNP